MDANRGTRAGSPRCFRELLVRITADHPPRQLAAELGVNPWTLYNYRNGRSSFPVDLVAPLYIATGDREIIDFVLAGTDLVAVPKGKPAKGDVVAEVMRALALMADGKSAKGSASALTRAAALLLSFAREA
jgi:hypothetical protein